MIAHHRLAHEQPLRKSGVLQTLANESDDLVLTACQRRDFLGFPVAHVPVLRVSREDAGGEGPIQPDLARGRYGSFTSLVLHQAVMGREQGQLDT